VRIAKRNYGKVEVKKMPCKYKGKQLKAYHVTGGWKRKTRKKR
jgi:hypothetical protein